MKLSQLKESVGKIFSKKLWHSNLSLAHVECSLHIYVDYVDAKIVWVTFISYDLPLPLCVLRFVQSCQLDTDIRRLSLLFLSDVNKQNFINYIKTFWRDGWSLLSLSLNAVERFTFSRGKIAVSMGSDFNERSQNKNHYKSHDEPWCARARARLPVRLVSDQLTGTSWFLLQVSFYS